MPSRCTAFHRSARFLVLVLAWGLFDGCSSCVGGGGGAGCERGDPCETNDDCTGDEVCLESLCRLPCTQQSECTHDEEDMCRYERGPNDERVGAYCSWPTYLACSGGDCCYDFVAPPCTKLVATDDTCVEAGEAADGSQCELANGITGTCRYGACLSCTAQCSGRMCGTDGCGGTCGSCDPGWSCSLEGQCVNQVCEPQCVGRICGDDGCGGSCGGCGSDENCGTDGWCGPKPCVYDADCVGRCTNLGVCEECGCRYDGTCGALDKPGCCEDDGDCDTEHACNPATNLCYGNWDCSTNADCAGQCGVLANCDTCICGANDECTRTTTVPPACCVADSDCDDGLTCTADTCTSGACVKTPLEFGDCLFGDECFSGCFDNFDGCPCDGDTYGGCTSAEMPCEALAAQWDGKYCVHHCGGSCCRDTTDCPEGAICRYLLGEYHLGPEVVTEALLGTCVPPATPPDCWLDEDCPDGETCADVEKCPACHRAGEDGCTYASGTCTPVP